MLTECVYREYVCVRETRKKVWKIEWVPVLRLRQVHTENERKNNVFFLVILLNGIFSIFAGQTAFIVEVHVCVCVSSGRWGYLCACIDWLLIFSHFFLYSIAHFFFG